MSAGKFEALKYSLRQSKDGVVISLVVHPSDVSPELMALPIGARVEIEWTECTDEERQAGEATACDPVAGRSMRDGVLARGETPVGNDPVPATNSHNERKLSAQCFLRCGDANFWRWLSESGCVCRNEADAKAWVYSVVDIESRKELDADSGAASRWHGVEYDFQTWLTEQSHGALVR